MIQLMQPCEEESFILVLFCFFMCVRISRSSPKTHTLFTSPHKNYFRSTGQNVLEAFNALSNILIPCPRFFSVDNRQICLAILVSLARHFSCVEPCRTKCPVMLECSAWHQHKSAGHVRHFSGGLLLTKTFYFT